MSFCPYRISPLGAHIDHQLGIINGLAIDKGIHIAYSPKHNGVIELQSINFPGKRAQFHVAQIPSEKQNDWADHCRGAALILSRKYKITVGLSAVIEGTLPIAGLSSSASVIIAFLTALANVNDIWLDPWDVIMMAKAAENEYVGVNCGKLDQSCEVLCKKDQLLYLDCSDDSFHLIPWVGAPFSIAVFFSGLERSLASSAYNLRQDGLPVPPYAVYNIGGGTPENLLDYISSLQEELVRAGVLPEDYDFEAHRELVPMQPGDVPVTYADSTGLEKDYGFKPTIGIQEGLRSFAKWYKEYYN